MASPFESPYDELLHHHSALDAAISSRAAPEAGQNEQFDFMFYYGATMTCPMSQCRAFVLHKFTADVGELLEGLDLAYVTFLMSPIPMSSYIFIVRVIDPVVCICIFILVCWVIIVLASCG